MRGVETPKDHYYRWLTSLVAPLRPIDARASYHRLLAHLFEREFTHFKVRKDQHRADDGIALRYDWVNENPGATWGRSDFPFENCRVLEMMIALAGRAAYAEAAGHDDPGAARAFWFWEMCRMTGLNQQVDSQYSQTWTDASIDMVLDRTYSKDGDGSFFPVTGTYRNYNYKRMELWDQMNCYILERFYTH